MTKNEIALRKGFVNLCDAGANNLQLAMSVQSELMKYGFMLSEEAFKSVKKADSADIIEFHTDVINFLKEFTGNNHNFKSLFGNFPTDCLSMSSSERRFLQMVHYWTNRTFDFSDGSEDPKDAIYQCSKYTMLEPCSDDQFMKIFTDLCSVNQSLTPFDKKVLQWFAKSNLNLVYPDSIPFKENLATLAELLPGLRLKTVTDVLRVAVGFSGGDVSLPAVPKVVKGSKYQYLRSSSKSFIENKVKEKMAAFRFKLSNKQIDRIFELLENSNLDVREMKAKSKRGRWIRLGEIINPGRRKDAYPKTFNAFYALRNQDRQGRPKQEAKGYKTTPVIRTWNSDVNKAFKKDFQTGITKLAERPGEFFRRIDWMMRTTGAEKRQIVLKAMAKIAEKTSTKVLLEVLDHFIEREKPMTQRSVFIKGARNKVSLPILKPINKDITAAIADTIFVGLKAKFETLEPLGKCYIDPQLKNIPLPTNMRSMSDSLKPVVRGTRVKIDNCIQDGVLRAYVHWFNDGKRRQGCDIDLSATVFGKEQFLIGWNGRSTSGARGYLYSGDVTDRPGACAEYIDINLKKAKANGDKYIVFDARDYRQGGFNTYSQCVFGFNEIPESESKQDLRWSPSSITNAMQLQSSSNSTTIAIIDIQTMEYIWVDMDISNSNVASSDKGKLEKLIKDMSEPPRFSVYDLVRTHVEARGSLVTFEESEKAFMYEDFVNSYTETLKLMV